MCWQDGPAGKGTCYQATQPDFGPGDPHGRKKELTSESWTLKSVDVSLTETYKLEKYDWNEIKFTKVKVSFFLTSEMLAGLNKMTL